jgi:thiol-disulfide isomerase/thioredoxin
MINPKTKFARGVEIATNFSIIIVALIGATVLVKNYLLRPAVSPPTEIKQATSGERLADGPRPVRTSSAPPRAPEDGTRLSVPGVSWGDSNQTVVLALSDKCHYCSESAPFYQRLARDLANRKDVRLVAVFPQDVDASKKYLDGLGVPVGQVVQASLDSLQVRGTPTLVIVDKNGNVTQSWVGKLDSTRESQVLDRIKI